jgi:NTE family protein
MSCKVGLALGGGGARGIAHLGVYQRLIELGVPIHCIAGTSIGAIVGAIVASNNLASALEWCAEADWKKLPKLMLETSLTAKALTPGKRVEELLESLIAVKDFKNLEIPFAAIATDMITGDKIVMKEGDVLSAVRASMSIPGVFPPVKRNDRILVDGQLVDPVPVSVCREMGADVVIAVDINPPNTLSEMKPYEKFNLIDVLTSTINILNGRLTAQGFAKDPPDVLIQPNVSRTLALDFRNAGRLVDIGRQAVDAANLFECKNGKFAQKG